MPTPTTTYGIAECYTLGVSLGKINRIGRYPTPMLDWVRYVGWVKTGLVAY